MSTFLGLIEEIPGISVDRFDEENLGSSIFFLSHCHLDHMNGLSNNMFMNLHSNQKHLYCSPITKVLLGNIFTFESSCVKEIDIDTPTVIEYTLNQKNNNKILLFVTAIPAGHCPGSVMFLFEKDNVSVLYTGDFRVNPIDFPKLKCLHYREHTKLIPKTFTKVYLDTTFLSNNFKTFPTRQESIIKIRDITNYWLSKDPRNVVILECSALYGSEFLFIELSKMLGIKIHVRTHVYKSYCRIAELSCYVTNEPHSTRIHACKRKFSSKSLECRDDIKSEYIMTIIPSVRKWKDRDTSVVGEWDKSREQTFNVCYATHSSLEELKAFVQYFGIKASEIYPCVIPSIEESKIYKLLESITNKEEQVSVKQIYTLKLPKVSKVPFKSEYFSSDDDSS
ncbi:elongation factor 1-delta isoform X2 [Xylocopa sonorina]|uniref:elongation factor 1-delta isoform X2 n=1 Tax=Xylocopa sonorina TaxID=1818115 RepID=UPI00403B3661